VLELGCGDGALWRRNADRIPHGWRVTLTDISPGMVEEARRGMGPEAGRFKFLTADAEEIPFHDGQFDLVLANNMLYHVPDIPKAIGEIRRVLKPGGLLYASTMSKRHMQELERLAAAFDPELRVLDDAIDRFHFGNGADALAEAFADVRLLRYEDRLLVTEAEALVDYVTSTPMNARTRLAGGKRDKFRAYVASILGRQDGIFELTKENGIFVGRTRDDGTA